MQATTLEGVFGNPSFILIFLTILIATANILVGVSILPQDKRQKGYKLHSIIYYAVVICYCVFLWVTHSQSLNGWPNYAVLAYFLFVVPVARRINVTLHAVLASVGLVLLVGIATFCVLWFPYKNSVIRIFLREMNKVEWNHANYL